MHASHIYGKGERSNSLDSVYGRLNCSQLLESARALVRNVEGTCIPFKSSRTGQVRREREQRDRFNEGPLSPSVCSNTGFLDTGEQQSGIDRHRIKSSALCVDKESIFPLASNLTDRRCQRLAKAEGQPIKVSASVERPEPNSVAASWLTRAVPRPCEGRSVLPGTSDWLLQSCKRFLAFSITGGRRHIIPIRTGDSGCGIDIERSRKLLSASESGALSVGTCNGFRTRTGM